MKNLEFIWIRSFLKFRHPFGIASGTRSVTPVMFVRISSEGKHGYGEASMPPYLDETHETAENFFALAEKIIRSDRSGNSIEDIIASIDNISLGNSAAKAAIDIALHDLDGKIREQPCHRLFGIDARSTPSTTYTIGIGDHSLIGEKIIDAELYPVLKVKLGTKDDMGIIRAIRRSTDKPIAVDVNQGWRDIGFAIEMAQWLHEQGVILLEQPLPKGMTDEMSLLTEKSPMPTIADESCQRMDDVKQMKGIFSGINIKLMKCTGMSEARKMFALARECGLKILLGCMSESSCGASAAAQLSPLADWADLDGPLLLQQDPFHGITYKNGKIMLSDLPGTGAEPKEKLF